MAVYTSVGEVELDAFLAAYRVGAPVSLQGIAEGIENSNFLLTTGEGRFILTVFERRAKADDLPFFIDLMTHLSAHGFPAPEPVADRGGATLGTLCGKPACIVSFLEGRPIEPPGADACREAAAGAARMALASAGFAATRANDLGRSSWRRLFAGHEALADRLRPGLAGDIAADLDALDAAWPASLPTGVIHADLFPDNVFFQDDRFAGVIDFYFACTETLAYELAVMLNAWAFTTPTTFDLARGGALLEGYESVRALTPAERDALPILARGAAMRFFLTRLADWDSTPDGALVQRKDPLAYADRLALHRDAAAGRRPPLLKTSLRAPAKSPSE